MAKWNYQLRHGTALRRAVDDGDPMNVLDHLWSCYEELKDKGLIDEYDFDRYTGDFELYDVDDEGLEDEVDYELDEFYDLCDSIGVWIPID